MGKEEDAMQISTPESSNLVPCRQGNCFETYLKKCNPTADKARLFVGSKENRFPLFQYKVHKL